MEIFSKQFLEITESDLKNLENNPSNFESFQVEYKIDYDNAEELRKDVIQFSNGVEIGYIFFGFSNNPIKIIGIEKNKVDILKNVLNNVLPIKIDPSLLPFPEYNPVPLSNGKYVFIIKILPKESGIYGIRKSEKMDNSGYRNYEFYKRLDGSKYQMNVEDIISLIEDKGMIANLPEISTAPDPNDKRIDLLITIVKNLAIKYYKEGLKNNKFDSSLKNKINQLISIIHELRPSSVKQFLNFSDFINLNFKTNNIDEFIAKIRDNTFVIENKNRPIPILAGDLAFVINELYNEFPYNTENYLEKVRQDLEHIIQNNEFLQESYNGDRFNKAIDELKHCGVMRSDKYKGSDDKGKYKIHYLENLRNFMTKYSLHILLKRIF